MEKRRAPRSPVNTPAIIGVLPGIDIGFDQAVVIGNVRRAGLHAEGEQFLQQAPHPTLA